MATLPGRGPILADQGASLIDMILRRRAEQKAEEQGQQVLRALLGSAYGGPPQGVLPGMGGDISSLLGPSSPLPGAAPATDIQSLLANFAVQGVVNPSLGMVNSAAGMIPKKAADTPYMQNFKAWLSEPGNAGKGQADYAKALEDAKRGPEKDPLVDLIAYNKKTGRKYQTKVKTTEYDTKVSQLLEKDYSLEAPEPKAERSTQWKLYQDKLLGGYKGTFLQSLEDDAAKSKQPVDNSATYFTQEGNLRDSFRKDVGNFPVVSQAFSTLKNSVADPKLPPEEAAQSDMSLVFAFMKMVDPGSTVREGEYATAANTRGVPDSIRAQYNKVLTGETLSPKQRQGFLNQGKRIYSGAEQKTVSIENQYKKIATSYNLDPKKVIVDFRVPEEQSVNPAEQARKALGAKYSVVLEGAK